jgi:N-acetyl-gamma-glutamyl-phosphate/LysW-gamma-L-alpha-aminoadipyl-6-phosphate reductase
MIRAAVVGASGYVGGELLRLLLGHPEIDVAYAVSARLAGRRVDGVHPNLRAATDLSFRPLDEVNDCDVVFLAAAHLAALDLVPKLAGRAKCVIDLSADFRLRAPGTFRRYYGVEHPAPELVDGFVPGWPERYRDDLRGAERISVPGCMATAGILALYPLSRSGLAEPAVTVDARTGSSGSGATAGEHNIHAERSGAMRVFAPVGHRHEAEIAQATGFEVRMSATGVEAVRGVQVLCRARLRDDPAEPVTEARIRQVYREHYADEPFVRIVAQKRGGYRYPEPKILAGSNYCDVGFAVDADAREIVVIAALDNLMKGGAGNAVQCLNVRMGWPERLGLEFTGLHPN